jgi:hypothetical protein
MGQLYCKKCDFKVEQNWKFCRNCGEEKTPDFGHDDKGQSTGQHKSAPVELKIIAIGVVVSLIIAAGFALNRNHLLSPAEHPVKEVSKLTETANPTPFPQVSKTSNPSIATNYKSLLSTLKNRLEQKYQDTSCGYEALYNYLFYNCDLFQGVEPITSDPHLLGSVSIFTGPQSDLTRIRKFYKDSYSKVMYGKDSMMLIYASGSDLEAAAQMLRDTLQVA